MARLSTYLNDNSISGEDLLAGSNFVSFNAYETKNFKIKDLTEYIQGQISISPSNSTLKANGGIVTEIISGTNSLAVDLSATDITGQLANSDLVNSSITINGTAVALGGSITIGEVTGVTAGTYLNGGGTEGTVTVNHDATTRTNATSTASPAYGASFTAIDTLTTNTTGHVTAVNTKTITLPASDNTTYTVEAVASTNDSIIRLIDSDSNNDDIKLIAGDNISLSTNEENDTITINSQAFGTVFTVATEALMIAATTTGGDIVIRTDISKTFIHNGGSVGDVTDFSELQFSGINSITLTEGDGIDLSRTTLTNANNDLTITNNLATTTTRGGIQIGYTEDGKNYPVELDSEQAYVNVPWENTTYNVMGAGETADYSAGLVLEGSATHGDSFLRKDGTWEVPVDTDTTYSAFTTSAAGLAPQLPNSHGGKFLKADGTWEVPAYIADTNTQNTYSVSIPEDTQKIRLSGTISGGADTTADIEFVGGGATTVTRTNANKFTISSTDNDTDTNTQNTTTLSFVEAVDEASPPAATGNIILRNTTGGAGSGDDDINLNAGTNITLTHTDADNITIASTDTNTTNWNLTIDSVSPAENIAAGNTVTFDSGDRIQLTQTQKTISIAGKILTFADLNTVTSGMTGDDTLTFGDVGNDTSVVIRGNLQVTGTTTTNNVETVSTSNGIIFEGTAADNHELTLLAGALDADHTVTIPNATFTIPTQDTTYDVFTGAGPLTSGSTGLVPASAAGDQDKFLKANRSWATIPSNSFRTVKVDTDGDGTANNTLTATETLTFKKGTNVTLSEADGIITISSTNTEYDVVDGDGPGLAPQLPAAHGGKFLKADGTYAVPDYTTDTDTNTQNTYSIDIPASTTKFRLTGAGHDGATTDDIEFVGSGATTVTRTSASKFTISSTDNNDNTQLSTEAVQDIVGAMVSGNTETNIAVTYNDTAGKLNFASVDTNTDTNTNILSGGSISGNVSLTGNLTVGGSSKWLYVVPNAQGSAPTHTHGLALGWNYSSGGGSRESQIIFAPGSDATAAHELDCQLRFSYKAVNGTITTAAKIWSGGNFYVAGTMQATGGTSTQWNTAYGWGNHASAGYLTSSSTQSKYLRSDADDTSSGDLTVVSYKFNGNASDPTDTTATIYDQQNHGPTISGLGVCFRTGSTPSQTGKLNSNGTFTVSGDVVAFGTPSDVTLKENIKPIENALDKVEKLQGVTFDWKEKTEDILNIKEDIGFIAQDVQKVLPELVRENDNGKLSLRHQGVIPVLLEAIKELSDKIKVLENGSTN